MVVGLEDDYGTTAFGEVELHLVAHHLGLFRHVVAGHAVGVGTVAEDVTRLGAEVGQHAEVKSL